MADQEHYFTDDAKKIMEWNSRVELTEKFLQEKKLHFKDIRVEMLIAMGMPQNNL